MKVHSVQVRAASAAIASGITQLGEHMGKGIVRAGEWYRKRSGGKQKQVQISEASMRRCGRPSFPFPLDSAAAAAAGQSVHRLIFVPQP